MNNSRTSLVTSDSEQNSKSENKQLIGTKKTRTRQRPNFRNRLSELEEKINNSNSDATPRSDYDHEDVNKNLINETKTSKSRRKKETSSNKFTENSGQENEAFELEQMTTNVNIENEVQPTEAKPKRRARKAVKKSTSQEETEVRQEDPNILAVIIHKCDKLRTDINIYNPVVRVHVIDLDANGEYVTKTKKERDVLYFYEKVNRKLDFVSPIMTSPYNFKENKSIVPKWEEIIVFNEEFSHFTKPKPNVIILFEILDTVRSYESDATQIKSYTTQDTSKTWIRIAWAFLKVVGSDGTLNVEKKVRLQLYYSQHQYKLNEIDSLKPEIFDLYKEGPRVKYPASLHVTVKAILPPKTFTPTIGSYYLLEHEEFMQNIENETNPNITNTNLTNLTMKEHLDADISKTNIQDLANITTASEDIHKMKTKKIIWSRLAGLPCRIPNEKSLNLNASKKGCYSIKFSTSGSYLACGCVEDNHSSPVYIYDIPDGRLVMKYYGHFGLIYELNWSKLDKYLVTASNDATARIYDIENRSKDHFKILPHPTFVYTAKFHPDSLDIVCTAGYDKVIRIWSISAKSKKSQKYGELLQELFGHSGYINTICFSSDGFFLYSGDSAGSIKSWNAYSEKDIPRKEWTLKDDIKIDDIKNQSISYIQLHPNQFRLLVHMRDNQIKLVDLRLDTVIQRYKGAYSLNQNLRSAVSACGTFLFSSGGDTKVHCWNVDTGDKVDNIELNYLKPVRDIDFHPYDNFIAFCSFDTNAPITVYGFNSEKAAKNIYSSTMVMNNTTNLDNTIGSKRLVQTLEPTPSKETAIKESALKAKLAEDIAKFNAYQANRWKSVHEKLDSVYPSQYDQNANKNITDFINSSITISINDQKNKPEFKYKGPKEAQDIVVSLYDYKSQRSDELDLNRGDEILVLVRENENWWMGELVKTKQEGYFPASYVQEKSAFEAAMKKSQNINSTRMPRFTVRDALTEYEKVYETNALNSINRATSQLESSKRENKLPVSNIKSILTNKEGTLNKTYEVIPTLEPENMNYIDEVPTKDTANNGSSYQIKDQIKRRPFSHIIIKGGQQSSTNI